MATVLGLEMTRLVVVQKGQVEKVERGLTVGMIVIKLVAQEGISALMRAIGFRMLVALPLVRPRQV